MSLRQHSYKLLSDAAVLERLFVADKEVVACAWTEFQRRYARLFLKIIWQFERDADAVMEKYVYVCTRLAEDGFACLQKYNPEGHAVPPKLSTWLTIVVKNLCIEEHRVTQGRLRLPRALTHLSAFHQKVFMLAYWKGYPAQDIAQMLEGEEAAAGLSVAQVLDDIEALALRPSKTWADQTPTFVHWQDQQHDQDHMAPLLPGEEEPGLALIEHLTPEERLVVRLRFWEDLTAQEIATVLRDITPRQVYSLIEKALGKMRKRAEHEV